jgi:hypothetical protein
VAAVMSPPKAAIVAAVAVVVIPVGSTVRFFCSVPVQISLLVASRPGSNTKPLEFSDPSTTLPERLAAMGGDAKAIEMHLSLVSS